jgi:hypothetical protein
MLPVFNNVCARPYIAQSFDDLNGTNVLRNMKKIMLSPEAYIKIKEKLGREVNVYLLSHAENRTYVLENDASFPEVLSEEFVLSRILDTSSSARVASQFPENN